MGRPTGYKQSEEEKQKRSITMKKKYKDGKLTSPFKKGHHPWNYKLNKENDERLMKLSKDRTGSGNPSYRRKQSKETIEKRVSKLRSIPRPQETRDKIGKGNTGKVQSKEARIKIGLAGIGRIPWNKDKGYLYTKEQLNKMSVSQKKRFINNPKVKGYKLTQEHRLHLRQSRAKQIIPMIDTSIEIKIQNYLKELKIGFFTHYYCAEIEHSYQCDIFIPVQRSKDFFIRQPIIIECDGDYWHGNTETRFNNKEVSNKIKQQIEKDKIRTMELEARGFKVIRLWGSYIKNITLEDFKDGLFPTNSNI